MQLDVLVVLLKPGRDLCAGMLTAIFKLIPIMARLPISITERTLGLFKVTHDHETHGNLLFKFTHQTYFFS